MNKHEKVAVKNKCEKNIVKSQLKDNHSYMNSIHLDPKNAFRSSFYEKGKIKMMLEYGKTLKETNPLDKNYLVEEVDEMMKNEKVVNKNKYFKAITTKPIIRENKSNLFEDNYPLSEDEMVKVCTSKTFQIKNYYNYLYHQQTQKELQKIQKRNQSLQNMYKANLAVEEQGNFELKEKTLNKQEYPISNSHLSRPVGSFNMKEKDRIEKGKYIK